MSRCPHCGGKVELVAKSARERGVFEFTPPVKFNSVAAGTLDDFGGAPLASKREKPARPLNKWDILYPLLRGVGTGAVFGLPALAGALVFKARLPFAWGGAVFWVGAAKEWLGFNVYDFVMSVEQKLQRDINRDGAIGAPPPAPPVDVWVNRRGEDGETITSKYSLPLSAVKMTDFANFILSGGALSRDAVVKSTSLSQNDYNVLLDVLEERGFVERVGNKRELGRGGRALLKKLC